VDVEKQLDNTNARLESEVVTHKKLQDLYSELEKKYHDASEKLTKFQESQDGDLSTQVGSEYVFKWKVARYSIQCWYLFIYQVVWPSTPSNFLLIAKH